MPVTRLQRKSIFTGKVNERDIPVSSDRIIAYLNGTDTRYIQDAFPELSADDREFIKTGATPEEWEEMTAFSSEEREADDSYGDADA